MSSTVETAVEIRPFHVDIPDELMLDQRTSREFHSNVEGQRIGEVGDCAIQRAPTIPTTATRHRTCRGGTR